MKTYFLIALFLITFTGLYGQSINLKPGAEFEFDTHSANANTEGKYYASHDYTFWFKVAGKDGDNILLDCKLVRCIRGSDCFSAWTFRRLESCQAINLHSGTIVPECRCAIEFFVNTWFYQR